MEYHYINTLIKLNEDKLQPKKEDSNVDPPAFQKTHSHKNNFYIF